MSKESCENKLIVSLYITSFLCNCFSSPQHIWILFQGFYFSSRIPFGNKFNSHFHPIVSVLFCTMILTSVKAVSTVFALLSNYYLFSVYYYQSLVCLSCFFVRVLSFLWVPFYLLSLLRQRGYWVHSIALISITKANRESTLKKFTHFVNISEFWMGSPVFSIV